MARHVFPSIAFALLLLACEVAHAAPVPVQSTGDGTISLDEYLLALERIAPAARAGAEAYRDAYQRRCRRTLAVGELRRLVAEGSGDPVLMAMIGAAHRRDESDLQRLGATIVCNQRN